MMDEQRMVALSRLYIEERIAAAEKEQLLHDFGTRRAYVPAGAVWVGGVLVRIGHRLEALGGAAHTAPPFTMRRAV